jgi:energy-coupling factor transport system permease protein
VLRDITIGQYYPSNSALHHMDPRFKILATFSFLIILFFIKTLWAYIPIIFFLGFVIKTAKVPLKYVLRGLKPIVFIILFTVSINLFMTQGTALISLGPITVTYEGLRQAVFMAMRLMLLIMGSSMMTFTTSPIELTDGIEYLLNPFRRIGVPAHEIAMMMSIALRFIPTLLEETDKIMKAQMARGADFETGSLFKRAKSLVPILVPLFISAFRRADELAMAMESRCYRGGEFRTRMKILCFTKLDVLGTVMMLLLLFAVIWVNGYAL